MIFVAYILQKPFHTNQIVFKSKNYEEVKEFVTYNQHKYDSQIFITSLTSKQLKTFEPSREEFDDMYRAYCM